MTSLQKPNAEYASQHDDGENAPASTQEALQMQNGFAVPFAAVPLFSFSYFSHFLASKVRDGYRVASFFALPLERLPRHQATSLVENKAEENNFRLLAVLAAEDENRLLVFSADVGERYPSLTPKVPQVHLFEREMHEKHGITPVGHPWLKPVRFSKNDGPTIGSMDFYRVNGDEVHEVAVGPIHAGIIECGHFRFQCLGELVMHLEISLGYHHRGVESLLARGPHARTLPLMEAVAGDTTVAHAWAYCSLLEALTDTAPAPSGQLIRALALELERLACHTGDLGAIAGDVGFLPTLSYCGRLRGDWLNMSAMLCGSRFGRGLLAPGGAHFSISPELARQLRERLDLTARDVLGAIQLIWDSPSVMARLTGIGPVDTKTGLALGLVGPPARACGMERDCRTSHPLPELPQPPERALAQQGDVRARTWIRQAEISASVAFCRRLLEEFIQLDGEGAPSAFTEERETGANSLAVALVEGWRGEVCHVALTGRDGNFIEYSITDPSFHNWMGLTVALRGQQISDFPLCNKSFNLSYCGHDL